MKNYFYLFGAATLIAFASCSSDSNEEYGKDLSTARQIVPVSQISEMSTRADQGLQSTSIASDVKVRFCVTEAGNAAVSNQSLLTSDGSNGFSESTTNLYYPVSGYADIYGYAPATSAEISDLAADQNFEVQADQSINANYLASDLLVGSKKSVETPADESTSSYVVVTFKHILTKLNLNIEKSLNPASVRISNAKTKCTFNIKNGTVAATGASGSVIAATLSGSETATDGYYKFSAIIVPQQFSANTIMLEIATTDGETYTFTPSEAVTVESATEYTYKITATSAAKQVAMTLQSEVVNWTSTAEQEAIVKKAERTAHVGDWYTADGKYVDGSSTAPANTIGIVFSTEVGDADKAAGYTCYVSSLSDLGNKVWAPKGSTDKGTTDDPLLSTQVTSALVATGSAAESALDGRTETASIWAKTGTDYANLTAMLSAQSLSGYTSDGAFAAPASSSGWFVPSVGQMNQLVACIYEGVEATVNDGSITYTSTTGYTGTSWQNKLAALRTAGVVSGNSSFLDSGNPTYWTVSESDASTIWYAEIKAAGNATLKPASKTTNSGRRIHLILAAK